MIFSNEMKIDSERIQTEEFQCAIKPASRKNGLDGNGLKTPIVIDRGQALCNRARQA